MVGAGAGAGAGRWMLSRASLGLTDVFGMPPPLQERKQMILIIVESSKKNAVAHSGRRFERRHLPVRVKDVEVEKGVLRLAP